MPPSTTPSTPPSSKSEPSPPRTARSWESLLEALRRDRAKVAEGGGPKAIARQHEKNRLTARERIARLIDPQTARSSNSACGPRGRCTANGAAPGGRRRLRRRHRRRAAAHDHRQRRHGQGRRVLPDDGQKSAAGPADRHGESAAADLSRRFGRRLSAAAGRGLSRRGRFRPHLPQQRRHLGRRHRRRSPPSWATAWPAADICPCSATSC